MKVETINGQAYRLPGALSKFQKEMYVHLINWKWEHKIKEPGTYNYQGRKISYDAILPDSVIEEGKYPNIYEYVVKDMLTHKKLIDFKLHIHFNHMVSSQAANINLFLPILLSPKANEVFRTLKTGFDRLATGYLYKGFRIEFWDGNSIKEKGLLGDHNGRSGTDVDIAIAYYNTDGKLCLWLIEHKLTEREFTTCGAFKSKSRDKGKHLCGSSFDQIIENKDLCYYHNVRKNNYWALTDKHKEFFVNASKHKTCPFKGGMNQLWRNQILGLEIESNPNMPYEEVCFSVLNHPRNRALDHSIADYKTLIGKNPKFSSLTSEELIKATSSVDDKYLNEWVEWYRGMYNL